MAPPGFEMSQGFQEFVAARRSVFDLACVVPRIRIPAGRSKERASVTVFRLSSPSGQASKADAWLDLS